MERVTVATDASATSWVALAALALGACAAATPLDGEVRYDPGESVSGWSEDDLGPEVGIPMAPGAEAGASAPGPGEGADPAMVPAPTAGAGGSAPMVPTAGSGGGEPVAGMGGTMVTPLPGGTPTSLTLDFTTADQGGKYSPANIGAVWVTDGSGRWVRTLEYWAFIRAKYLSKYNAAGAGLATDAISGATFAVHLAHHRVWDLKDSTGAVVPDGPYTIFIEVTDREDAPGAWTQIPFMKGPTGQVITPPDEAAFTNIKVTYQ